MSRFWELDDSSCDWLFRFLVLAMIRQLSYITPAKPCSYREQRLLFRINRFLYFFWLGF